MLRTSTLRYLLLDEGVLRTARRPDERLPSQKKAYDRILSMEKKSTRGGQLDPNRMMNYARNMARAIKDWAKAERRGSAALLVGHKEVADLFYQRADELRGGAPATAPKAPRKRKEPLVPEDAPDLDWSIRKEDFWVLPMGSVNLRNGNNRMFNFLTEWGGEDFTFIVCDRRDSGKRVVLLGSGGTYSRRGAPVQVVHSQTQRTLFNGVVVREITGKMDEALLEKVRRVVGRNSCLSYVLK